MYHRLSLQISGETNSGNGVGCRLFVTINAESAGTVITISEGDTAEVARTPRREKSYKKQ